MKKRVKLNNWPGFRIADRTGSVGDDEPFPQNMGSVRRFLQPKGAREIARIKCTREKIAQDEAAKAASAAQFGRPGNYHQRHADSEDWTKSNLFENADVVMSKWAELKEKVSPASTPKAPSANPRAQAPASTAAVALPSRDPQRRKGRKVTSNLKLSARAWSPEEYASLIDQRSVELLAADSICRMKKINQLETKLQDLKSLSRQSSKPYPRKIARMSRQRQKMRFSLRRLERDMRRILEMDEEFARLEAKQAGLPRDHQHGRHDAFSCSLATRGNLGAKGYRCLPPPFFPRMGRTADGLGVMSMLIRGRRY